jgi:hypothetical protein
MDSAAEEVVSAIEEVRVRRGNCNERSEELWVGENRQLGCWEYQQPT